ncbi:armadillo-type protein [Entophlyctis helioformis]|nr:armadillo-type protein [Entophlyctis helioformis]
MDDLRKAVELAFSFNADPLIKSQATDYCNQVRLSARGWELCLAGLAQHAQGAPSASGAAPPSGAAGAPSAEFLFFCLQVIEDVLRNRHATLAPADRLLVQQSIWSLYQPFVTDPSKPAFVRNKLFVVVVLVFRHQYPEEWPTFFEQLFATLNAATDAQQRPLALAFLRICLTIDEERSPEDAARNTLVKDWMREGPVARLVETWLAFMRSSYQTDLEITNTCLKLYAAYVSWVDINLIMQPDFVDALLGFMHIESLQICACDCLTAIVGKGMRVADKLQLLQVLKLPAMLGTLGDASDEFDEQVAKLVNIMGLELIAFERDQAVAAVQALFPFLLKYLANEYDDTVSALLSFVGSFLLLIRRLKKDAPGHNIRDNLYQLLQVLITKMKYLDDDEFKIGSDAGESEALFIELRKHLKGFLESIAAIDSELFISCVSATVCHNMDLLAQGTQAGKQLQDILSWPDVEVSLYLLHVFIEAKPFKGNSINSSPVYVLESGALSPLGQMLAKMFDSGVASYPHISIPLIYYEILIRYSQFLEQCQHYLPQAMQAFVDTRGLHHPNKTIRLRLNYLFLRFIKPLRQQMGSYIEGVLESIQDLLVIKPREHTPATAGAAAASAAFGSTGGLSGSIDAGLAAEGSASDNNTEFDSQLYLFEAVGLLISTDTVDPAKRAMLLQNVLSPHIFVIESFLQQRQAMRSQSLDEQAIPLLSDTITAIGSISKGFPEFVSDPAAANGRAPMDADAMQMFQEALRRILLVLQQLSSDARIREATRFSLQRMVGCVGPAILDHLPTFLSSGLLSSSTANELIDFLPFVGLMIYKFKASIMGILVNLWIPLREKIFLFLNQPAAGTDDYLQQLALRRAYLTLLSALFNSDLTQVLTSPSNIGELNTTLMSILMCLDESSDASVHKLVFSLFSKMIYCWAGGAVLSPPLGPAAAASAGAGATPSPAGLNAAAGPNGIPAARTSSQGSTDGAGQRTAGAPGAAGKKSASTAGSANRPREPELQRAPLEGFDQFVFQSMVPALFEVPLRASFDTGDGQGVMVLGEIAGSHKTAVEVLGLPYVQYLSKVYLPSRGCPDALSQAFADNLVGLDKKGFKKYLQAFVRSARSSASA